MKRWLLSLIFAFTSSCALAASAPATIKADYDVYKDGLHIATVAENFQKNGDRYQIESDSTPAGLLAVFIKTRIKVESSGKVNGTGLQPDKLDYGRLDDASKNVSAAFDWQAHALHLAFDGRKETLPLAPGTQDRLSVMYQFLFLPPEKLKRLEFQMTNGKKIENYRYDFIGEEELDTPLGKIKTLHLAKHRDPGENGTEVWLAADRHHFPVKLLILENDGSKFEQVITKLTIQ